MDSQLDYPIFEPQLDSPIFVSFCRLISDNSTGIFPLPHQYKYIDDENLFRRQLHHYARRLAYRQERGLEFLVDYINAMHEEVMRENSSKDDFIYALLQSLFVVELIYNCTDNDLVEENDPIFLRGETLQKAILKILMHTTLPFKYLKTAFRLTEERQNKYFYVVARFMMEELCLGPIHVDYDHPYEEAQHLLAFVHNMWVHSSEFWFKRTASKSSEMLFINIQDRKRPEKRRRRRRVIQNATELQRAGIRFIGVWRPTFDIRFRRGSLEIPVLTIVTETHMLLQNFLDYEKNSPENAMLVVTDYCIFMDCLIQSSQDVQLLRESGVIESYLHDDKDVVALFDKLGKRVPPSTHFCYSHLFDQVNRYCVQTWNSWKAKFRRNYFREDNQLEAVSFMFAIYIILPVTILQTVYTVLSYYKGGG